MTEQAAPPFPPSGVPVGHDPVNGFIGPHGPAGPDGTSPSRHSPTRVVRRLWHWLATPDGRAVAVLLAVPALAFVIPALLGAPALAGDNLVQNYPLRAFTGELVRQGHLPLWNPYIWSGTPLLGGMNAGAFYPSTFAFVIITPVAAWVLNLVTAYWAGGLGCYWLLRQYRIRPLASLLGAGIYAFGGSMVGQMVHLGIVQGLGLMPFIVLAVLKISWAVFGVGPVGRSGAAAGADDAPAARVATNGAVPDSAVLNGDPGGGDPGGGVSDQRAPGGAVAARTRGSGTWAWVIFLAVLVGLVMLTGEPRSIAETEIVTAVMVIWLALRGYGGGVTWARRARFVGATVLASLWGVAIGAAQLLPGYEFISLSQRADEPYSFFGSGSLHTQWTVLMLLPDLFGGNGVFHQPIYFNEYNLAEVTGYVGLLPLVACFALLTRTFGRHRDPAAADWAPWIFLVVLGLLLTWGEYTPLGGVFGHIPLFGRTRLQSRNLGIVDLGLAVLFAFWADRMFDRRLASTSSGAERLRRWFSVLPALAAVALCVAAIAFRGPLESAFGAAGSSVGLTPWFVAQLGVAVAVVALVLQWPHVPRSLRAPLLSVVVVVDIGLFCLSSATGFATVSPNQARPSPAAARAVLGADGRFALYAPITAWQEFAAIGQTNLNDFTLLPSVQGYGSIVGNAYGRATGTHVLDTLSTCALAQGVFTPLRLDTLLTAAAWLAPPVPPSGQVVPPPPACPGAAPAGTAQQRTWYFGQTLSVTGATLVTTGPTAFSQVGLLDPNGTVSWPAITAAPTTPTTPPGDHTVAFGAPTQAVGLVVRGSPQAVSDTSVVTTAGGPAYSLDGILQDAMGQTGWRFAGTWSSYARFKTTSVLPPVWVANGPPGASATQIQTTDYGTEVDRVTTSAPTLLVRSTSDLPGWRASAVPVGGGPARSLPIEPVGLIQGVRLPAGSWTVTFKYRAPGLDGGLAGSGLGLAALLGAGGVWAVRRRRTRPPSTG